MTSDILVDFRKHFPAVSNGVFTNVAQRGLIPTPVYDSITNYLTSRTDLTWSKEQAFTMVEETRESFASFVNASPSEIAFTKNVSEGINLVAGAISWNQGDKVILCPDLEHPANVFPWYNVAKLHDVEISSVPASKEGHFDLDRIAAAIDKRTKVISVSTVSFSPGFVTDVSGLASICREKGVRLIVDAAQSVGILHTDVRELGVDALAVATQKGLLSCYGCGFLYCSSEFSEELQPASLARFSVATDENSHETTLIEQKFRYAPGARRFDGGNYNYLGITGVRSALKLLSDIGTPLIEKHVRRLSRKLVDGLLEVGLPICGGRPGNHLGHIVAVGVSGGGRHYTAEDPAMNILHDRLVQNGVHLSIRRGVLRFSLHGYNNEEDINRIIDIATSS
ncbi:MAG: aminotransferase class V-fold PLP-dependent enzyme [Gemmatimonadetes bacterium]|jgi:cysteine desulfurase/selenocysteine lyase|nr:aminotransferase class V-fold PLP-dependent enzyme [Gemmatimonadota bacterium]